MPFLLNLLILTLSSLALGQSQDPSAELKAYTLDNGLRVILAPSATAKTLQMRVRVDAGFRNEAPGKAGTAHLLEHYLFSDAKMDKGMTYLEVIKEKGGSGNASTGQDNTAYYATLPAADALWTVDTFYKILFEKEFTEAEVEFAKGPVFLEIGQPSPSDYFEEAMHYIWPGFGRLPDFWETEFAVKPFIRPAGSDRINTAGLTALDLKSFYEDYYQPSNMTVYFVGKFQADKVAARIKESFGKVPAGVTKPFDDPMPQAKIGTYFRSKSTSGTPYIEVGTKLSEMSLKDQVAVLIYMEHLAHRLMKDVRNTQGDTYTARADISTDRRHGWAGIEMEASPENYQKILSKIRNLIEQETRQGEISQQHFDEAVNLFSSSFALTERDSDTMMSLATLHDDLDRTYSNYAPEGPSFYEI